MSFYIALWKSVQDTNVFVAALRNQEGASAEVLDRCLALEDQAVMGAALFAEYEQLVQRESFVAGRAGDNGGT